MGGVYFHDADKHLTLVLLYRLYRRYRLNYFIDLTTL
jgi:hypothetical protein